jgi:DNA-binding IclR family transcriptional regulator
MESSSTGRVVKLINFLAAHSSESFTLSQICEQVRLSHASAHRVLATLVAERYVSRHPKHKTYSLGVAVVRIGQAALERHRDIDLARREIAKLSEELNVLSTISVVMDGEMLILAKHGTPQTFPGLNRVGDRRPFVPPIGLPNIAWAETAVVEEYLARLPPDFRPELHQRLREAMRLVRERGYSIVVSGPMIFEWSQLTMDETRTWDASYMAEVNGFIRRMSPDEIQLGRLSDAADRSIGYMTAPVFSPTGEVALEIAISGLPPNMSMQQIERYSARLRAATAVVMSETKGRIPTSKNQIG